MANHDLRCRDCGHVYYDVNISIHVGALEYCKTNYCTCSLGADSTLEPIPAAHFSGFNDSGAGSFAKFTTVVEDPGAPTGYREITISSLADIRREERESEVRERNGEGQRLCWRDYSQDASNKDKHTMMDDPSLKPSKFYSNGTPVKVRRGAPVIADHGTVEQAQAAEGGS